MKVSYLKSASDEKSFKIFKGLGFDVFELEDPERTDEKLKELVNNKYTTIVVSNEIAGYSEDIIRKYNKKQGFNIIIAPGKNSEQDKL